MLHTIVVLMKRNVFGTLTNEKKDKIIIQFFYSTLHQSLVRLLDALMPIRF